MTVEDSSWVNYTMPQLTAVHVPMYEMGIQATETLLHMLAEPGGETQHIIVPTQFIERASTGSAPAAE